MSVDFFVGKFSEIACELVPGLLCYSCTFSLRNWWCDLCLCTLSLSQNNGQL
ncbi:hypothetical protein ACE6H2_010499 [Prunus campanulata]